jgi:Bacterial SH3 domain
MTRTPPPGLPRRRALALATLAALAAGAVFAESGTVLKDTPLRSEPLASASEVGRLKARETVEITARKGAWAGVKTPAGTEGWARILNRLRRHGVGQRFTAGLGVRHRFQRQLGQHRREGSFGG